MLRELPLQTLQRSAVLFRPGDAAQAFVIVVSGRIDVYLTGTSGREIMLYSVEPGQTCVQTTLGLLAGEPYTGEAVVAETTQLVLVPQGHFDSMMRDDPAFRHFVLTALGRRMTDVTRLLERVAFARIGARVAATLLDMARDGVVHATHAEQAAHVGTAREVVSRQLEIFARQGWVATERGQVRILKEAPLRQLAAELP